MCSTVHVFDLPSPLKKARRDRGEPNPLGLLPFGDIRDDFENVFEDPTRPSNNASSSEKAARKADQPMRGWIPLQDEYLAELIRLEGCGDVCLTHCPHMSGEHATGIAALPLPGLHGPRSLLSRLLCKGSCATPAGPHRAMERYTIRARYPQVDGLRVQLGHHTGEMCPRPITGHKKFTVIHTNGIHDVAVNFCGCRDEIFVGSRRQQLLCRSWYPATHKEPQTCSTLVALEMFHIMTLQGKVMTYDFYSGLEKLTNNTGLVKVRRCLSGEGRGNDGARLVAETRSGELAVGCLACPRPGVNLPDDWQSAPPKRKALYIMFIAIDACFQLKHRLVSSEAKDPGLGTGWSYFVEDTLFQHFLLSVTDQQERLGGARLRQLPGVGLGVCARHEFVLANSAVDLQKGERWSKHLIEWLKKLPANVQLTLVQALMRFVIPKLHIYEHKLFSLNYLLNAVRTDGEGIERPWANIGPVATSTREMGPGSRHDTLNDHWGHWNWQKLVGLGDLLKKQLIRAIPERNTQRDSLATFTENQAEHVAGWKVMVEEFEMDQEMPLDARTKPNPYELPKSGLSENDIRLELAQEEAAEHERGLLPINNVSPSAFILAGLDLEEQQRRIRVAAKAHKNGSSSKQSAELIEKRTKLARYVARFRKLQAVYMPGALQALADRPPEDEAGAVLAENVPLFLPSGLSEDLRATGCNKGVEGIELRFRNAQCRSALDHIRNHLYIKSRFRTYKGGNYVVYGVALRLHEKEVVEVPGLWFSARCYTETQN
ncbi:hypothetical protein B0H14DRAFT_2583881 [Mycena olivaceomarginata]|nr:hypothetical protein B0H14DRAFT_2583881 [Mycena olivaceomarginata]